MNTLQKDAAILVSFFIAGNGTEEELPWKIIRLLLVSLRCLGNAVKKIAELAALLMMSVICQFFLLCS